MVVYLDTNFISLGKIIGCDNFPSEFVMREPLYVRRAYIEILPLLCGKIDGIREARMQLNSSVSITGTPGMGKSYFLGYVWCQLIMKGFRVVARVASGTLMSSEDGKHYEDITGKNVKHYLTMDTVYLLDPEKGYAPPRTEALTVLFVSPSIERLGDLKRVGMCSIYMPPWSRDELHDCVKKLYPLALDEFDDRYKIWGGSLRSMRLDEKGLEEQLEDFLESPDLINIVNIIGATKYLKKEQQEYQWAVHRLPIQSEDGGTNYEECNYDFPSRYIGEKVMEKINHLCVDWKTKPASGLLGRAYEWHVLKVLFAISERDYLPVQAQPVGSGATAPVNIEAVRYHKLFSSKQHIKKPDERTLYIPSEPNRPGIDFVMPPWVFQVTIAKSHSAKRLNELFEKFPSVKKWKACFIVPTAVLDVFTLPRLSLYPKIVEKYILPFDFNSSVTK